MLDPQGLNIKAKECFQKDDVKALKQVVIRHGGLDNQLRVIQAINFWAEGAAKHDFEIVRVAATNEKFVPKSGATNILQWLLDTFEWDTYDILDVYDVATTMGRNHVCQILSSCQNSLIVDTLYASSDPLDRNRDIIHKHISSFRGDKRLIIKSGQFCNTRSLGRVQFVCIHPNALFETGSWQEIRTKGTVEIPSINDKRFIISVIVRDFVGGECFNINVHDLIE